MKKTKLEQVHYWVLGLWLIALVLAVTQFFSVNQGGGKFQDLIAAVAVGLLLAGILVVGIAAGVARFLFSGRYTRLGVVVAIPALVVVWLFSVSGPGADAFPPGSSSTGLTSEYIPEPYVHSGTGSGSGEDYDIYVSRADVDSQIFIGIRREGMAYPPGHQVIRGVREFLVVDEPDRTLVVENLGMVKIEISSNSLTEPVLLDIAESTRYDPDLDLKRLRP